MVKNTDIASYMASTLNVDLAATTSRLFRDAASMFAKKGAFVSMDKSDPENPVLVVAKGDQTLQIPRNKSIVYLNGETVDSDGVAVFTVATRNPLSFSFAQIGGNSAGIFHELQLLFKGAGDSVFQLFSIAAFYHRGVEKIIFRLFEDGACDVSMPWTDRKCNIESFQQFKIRLNRLGIFF